MEGDKTHYAICLLKEDNNSGVNGVVKFTQKEGDKVKVEAEVKGLKKGKHGFHVHEFGMFLTFLTLMQAT